MSLNIKNPKAHELATQLAQLTGESLTEVIIHSLELRLQHATSTSSPTRTADRIMAFAERFSRNRPCDMTSEEHAALLYGEDGLPR